MDIENAIANAQRLMLSEEFNQKVESYAKRGGSGKKATSGDLAQFEAMAFGAPSTQPSRQIEMQPIREQRTNSKVPKEILESYEKMPSPYAEKNIGTYLNQAGMAPQSAAINYDTIKYIVNEVFKENFEKVLNESQNSIRGFKLGTGNVIQVVDKQGNLWEGALKLKKKAK
jgi:hypothetical protein